MDILITIPKSVDWEIWLKECEAVANDPNSRLNYRIGHGYLPKNAGPGDRCYVVYDGYVRGYHIIDDICYRESFVCETTGKHWPGGAYIIRKGKFHEISTKIQQKGFQGWRYFKWRD